MTIRRDLNILEERNLVQLVHGAAIYNKGAVSTTGDKKYELHDEKDKRAREKLAIGEKAVSLIEPHDVIIIDAGTTTEYMARLLPEDIPLTVICFTANVLVEIYKKPSVKIYFAGGYYHRNTQMFESPEGLEMIKRICATKSFISAAGVCQKLGVTCVNQYEVKTKRACIDSSLDNVLLLDSTKFNQIRPSYFAKLTEFNTIITDSGIKPQWKEYINELGITLYVV